MARYALRFLRKYSYYTQYVYWDAVLHTVKQDQIK
jgi:hypothetical protein